MAETKPIKKKRTLLTRLLRIFGWIVVSLIALVILVLILIQLPFVQNIARKKVVTYLENKLHTKVEIGKLDVDFPTALSLQKVYFEDKSKDTLLYGKEIKVDISMLKLLRNEIRIQEIYLDGIVANMVRQPPDSTFNFQFIIDAFTSEKTKEPAKEDTATLNMSINKIVIDNSHFIYKDLYTGNDLNLSLAHFRSDIKTFDPDHMLFDISLIEAKGVRGYFYQLEPLQKPVEQTIAEANTEPGNVMQLMNEEIKLEDVDFQFNSDASHLKSSYKIGKADVQPEKIDLKNMVIALKKASLQNSDIVIETNTAKADKPPVIDTITTGKTPSLQIIATNLSLKNSSFKIDDLSRPHQAQGMDYAHLYLQDINLEASRLKYSEDTTRVSIESGSFKEQSGFTLNNMQGDFIMTPNGISLTNLYIKTPGSEIGRFAVISYPSLEALQQNPGVLELDIELENSKVSVKDLLTFVPQLATQVRLPANDQLFVNARITGSVGNMNFQELKLHGLSGTDIDFHGTISGLPDPNKITANLNIANLTTNRRDIQSFTPPNTIPDNISLPESISANGIIRGNMQRLFTDLSIVTNLGSAAINGSVANITDQKIASYDIAVNGRSIQLGRILNNPELGIFTGSIKATGSGLDPQTANATFSANIPVVTYHQYNYRNLHASGKFNNGNFTIDLSLKDPNLSTDMAINGNFMGSYPAIQLQGIVDSVNVMALNFSETPLKYHGRIRADFSNTNPDDLNGNLYITKSILVNNGQRITIDSMTVMAETGDTNRIALNTGFASLTLKGQYKLTQLGDVFINAINPYFKITDAPAVKVDPYHFTITGNIYKNPALDAVVPGLNNMQTIKLDGAFASDSGFHVSLVSPHLDYKGMIVDDVNIMAKSGDSVLSLNANMSHFKSGENIDVYATDLKATLADNRLNFGLSIKDQNSKLKYALAGFLDQKPDGYALSLKDDSLKLNYQTWSINNDNFIEFGKKGILAHNFNLSQNNQQLKINSVENNFSSPVKIEFFDFKLSTITGFVQTDSLMVNGLLNGNASVRNLAASPVFTSDLTVNDLSVYNDTLGNLTAKIDNNTANQYHADINLTGRGNQIGIKGDYFLKPKNSSFDFVLNLDRFQMKSLEGLTKGAIREARGFIYGKVAVNGRLDNPNIDGKIQFDNTAFVPSMLNNVFKVDKEAVAIINNEGVRFNKFTIRDTAENQMVIDGEVYTKNWFDYRFDLSVKADNFQAINSTKKDNELFFGKMVFSTNLNITGTPDQPKIDGDLTINKNTSFTVVLPQEEPGIAQRKGIVRFVDYSATQEDSLFMAPYDSLKKAPLIGYDVAVNINIDKEATFNMIVDAANGDFLNLRGTGQLTGGIDPSGKINLTGSYEIEEGSYALSFNFIKRKFQIQKGSRIVWTGDPTSAQVDVTAVYVANTAPYDLVEGSVEGNTIYYKQKLPFEVHLNMDGELLKPQITFDIVLPEEKNYTVSNAVVNTVQQRLTQLRQESSEMNKQVFALLLLNRFVGQNPFDNGSGGGMDANTFAKQSVSRLLTEQLNSLTEGLIQGVDLNFELATTEDYTTGSKQDRTDFKVGVTKRLLSDRLTVTVGSNFELEGPQPANGQKNNIAGDISVNYKLSKDGRYMLRAYRQNDYTGALEGYVIETGLTFIITLDYNKFSEIFKSKEERRKKREIKKENKEARKENQELMEEQKTVTPPAVEAEKQKHNEE